MDIISLRRFLHQYAEVGFTEFRTTCTVVQTLQLYGYDVKYGPDVLDASSRRGLPAESELDAAYQRALSGGADPVITERMRGGFTGAIGVLRGNRPGPTIAFRFDLDALPVRESHDQDHIPHVQGFASLHEGNMHACGHDGHTAIGLGLAERMKDRNFAGTLKLVFQPAEEGGRGAYAMVNKGIMDDVDRLFCFHLGMDVPSGVIYGGFTNWLNVTKYLAHFRGFSSHSGMHPEKGRHALLAAANALLNIHAISRFASSDTRLNVGRLEGGDSSNIIPSYARMLLESRANVKEVNIELERRVRQILELSAQMHDVKCEIEITGGATSIHCDDELVSLVIQVASKVEGIEQARQTLHVSGGEDACFLMERVQKLGGKATYMIIGSTIPYPHHNEKFDFDEKVMPTTVDLLERIVLQNK